MESKLNLRIVDKSKGYSPVCLEARPGVGTKDAIKKAAKFCKDYDLECCDLICNGFLFDITADITEATIKQKLQEYESSKASN